MGLFKKKKEVEEEGILPELPELPELPKLPESPKPEIRLPKIKPLKISPEPYNPINIRSLPSFPNSQIGESLSQTAIKSTIEPPEIPYFKERRTFELPEGEQEQMIPSMLPTQSIMPPVSAIHTSKKIEPVYIRIDKFKSAINSFQEIQAKISEIDILLAKIREQKNKEDGELREWEREIETIKARIEAIDRNIFSKID